jgi:benzoyl-CoA reductase subunit C
VEREVKKQLERAWRETATVVGDLKKKSGAKAVGLVLTDVPHELVHAAGALPVALLGQEVEFLHADKHVQGFACTYSRTVVELAENGGFKHLDGIIIPYACDTTRCLDLIFKYMNKYAFTDCIRLPKRTNADGVNAYYRGELERLGRALSAFTGVEATDVRLGQSIALYNRVRALLAKLRGALRAGAKGLTAGEYLSAVRAAMVLPPEASTPLLEEAVAAVGPDDSGVDGRPRVVVAGKLPEPVGLFEAIEQAGLRIIEDHLVVGGRWILATVPETGDPMDALVLRQLGRLPFAGIWDERDSRGSYLLERVRETGAHGAIFLVQKFCEPAELDFPGIKEEADKLGVPILLLETDFRPATLETIRTRIEAFAEMLKAKR